MQRIQGTGAHDQWPSGRWRWRPRLPQLASPASRPRPLTPLLSTPSLLLAPACLPLAWFPSHRASPCLPATIREQAGGSSVPASHPASLPSCLPFLPPGCLPFSTPPTHRLPPARGCRNRNRLSKPIAEAALHLLSSPKLTQEKLAASRPPISPLLGDHGISSKKTRGNVPGAVGRFQQHCFGCRPWANTALAADLGIFSRKCPWAKVG